MIYAKGFSRDYDRLRKLLDDGYEVICFAARKVDGTVRRELCLAEYIDNGVECFRAYVLRTAGMELVRFSEGSTGFKYYPKTFGEMMERHDVEFIDFKL